MPRSTHSNVEHDTSEAVEVSALVFARVLDLVQRPPMPNAKLRKVIAALPNTL